MTKTMDKIKFAKYLKKEITRLFKLEVIARQENDNDCLVFIKGQIKAIDLIITKTLIGDFNND